MTLKMDSILFQSFGINPYGSGIFANQGLGAKIFEAFAVESLAAHHEKVELAMKYACP